MSSASDLCKLRRIYLSLDLISLVDNAKHITVSFVVHASVSFGTCVSRLLFLSYTFYCLVVPTIIMANKDFHIIRL